MLIFFWVQLGLFLKNKRKIYKKKLLQGKSRKDLSSDSEDEKRRRRRDEKKKGKSGYKNRHRFVVKIDLRAGRCSISW